MSALQFPGTKYPTFETPSQLRGLCDNPSLHQYLSPHIQNLGLSSLAAAMRDFNFTAELLQGAIYGSMGHACHNKIQEISLVFQTVIKEASSTPDRFIDAYLGSQKNHVQTVAQHEEGASVINIVQSLKENLSSIQQISSLFHQLLLLTENLRESLEKTCTDMILAGQLRTEVKKRVLTILHQIKQTTSNRKNLQTDFQNQLRQQQELETIKAKELEAALGEKFIFYLVSSLIQPIMNPVAPTKEGEASSALDNSVSFKTLSERLQDSLRESESAAHLVKKEIEGSRDQLKITLETTSSEGKSAIQQQIARIEERIAQLENQIERTSVVLAQTTKIVKSESPQTQNDLALKAKKLKTMIEQNLKDFVTAEEAIVNLQKKVIDEQGWVNFAQIALPIALYTVDVITAILSNACIHWDQIKARYELLGRIENLGDSLGQGEFREALGASRYQWLAWIKDSFQAQDLAQQLQKRGTTLSAKPTIEEARDLVKTTPLGPNRRKATPSQNKTSE